MKTLKRKLLAIAASSALAITAAVSLAPGASAAVSYPVSDTVNIRSGPGTNYGILGTVPAGTWQTFDCYLTGTSVGGDNVWGHRTSGGYIADLYIKAGGWTLAQLGVPKCGTGFSYSIKETVNVRSGPGTGYSVVTTAAGGSVQTFDCYALGTSVGGDSVWGHLADGRGYISDYYVNVGGRLMSAAGVPQCGGNPPPPPPPPNQFSATALQQEFATYMKNHGNTYGGYWLPDNGCTTIAAWFVGTHTNLTYGHGNGQNVVQYMVNSNSGLSVTTSLTSAQVPALFSVAAGSKSWGASGGSYGHTGIVVSVSGNTATVLWTWSGMGTDPNRSTISTYTIPAAGVTFVSLAGRTR